MKDYFKVSEAFTYFFRKKDPNRPKNTSLKFMHGVNKFSMLMFLVGMLIFLISKFF